MIELISLVSKVVPEDQLLDLLIKSINKYKSDKSDKNMSELKTMLSVIGFKIISPNGIDDFNQFMKDKNSEKEN